MSQVIGFHSMKSVHIRSYSGLYFPAFGLNSDQNNSEYGHFLRSVYHNKQTLQPLKEVIKCNKVKDEFPVFLMVG